MLKQKKSQIFTLIALALLLLFFVSYEVYSIARENSIKTRIKTMDSFLFSLEKDLERQLYISGFRIIFLAETQIAKTGSYISNFDAFFDEAINQGTIYGEETAIMQGARITDIQESIQKKADKMNLNLEFSDVSVSVRQEDPWNIIVYFNASLNLTDKSDLARWYKKEEIKAFVSIIGFEDPLYLIETNGKVSRKINRTEYEGNYVSDSDITNLFAHLQRKYYTENSLAPSFLDRLEGKNQGNNNGIESFVYLPELSAQGLQVQEKSVVDYIYFSSLNPNSYKVSGMPSWFLIDSEHIDKYQVSGLTY